MNIRFPSLISPNKTGYEFTGDSMTFWDAAYRNGGVLHGAFGQYDTYGDGSTQHSSLYPCGVGQFTDFCISLTDTVLKNPDQFAGLGAIAYTFGLDRISPDKIKFLAGIFVKEDKPQWFNFGDAKVTTSRSKEHDKRWHKVPADANATIASAYDLYFLTVEHRTNYLWELYVLQTFFWETLYGQVPEGDRWEKITEWQKQIPGNHRQAFMALRAVIQASQKIDYAGRAIQSALYNSKPKEEKVNV